jgi:hypothetical protein
LMQMQMYQQYPLQQYPLQQVLLHKLIYSCEYISARQALSLLKEWYCKIPSSRVNPPRFTRYYHSSPMWFITPLYTGDITNCIDFWWFIIPVSTAVFLVILPGDFRFRFLNLSM